jgi:hypothetical protein
MSGLTPDARQIGAARRPTTVDDDDGITKRVARATILR